MRKFLFIFLLLSTPVMASDYYVIAQPEEEPATTTFSVEIPNDNVGLVTTALCTNRNKAVSAENAKQVVIDYINSEVKNYKSVQTNADTGIQ